MKKQWSSPITKCDLCKVDLNKQTHFYDARTKYGPWALLCEDCFKKHTNRTLGTGCGQKYNTTTREKIAG